MSIVEIDGSFGEGGGQILRYALAFSALTLKPLRIYNIRAKRDNPGLRPQHLTAVKAIAKLTNGEVENAYVGSTSLVFKPRERLCGEFYFDIGTAGSVSLVIQAILPVLLYADCRSKVTLHGGTNVTWSPPIDYMIHVFKHNLKLFNIDLDIKVKRRGHYPRGGGIVELTVTPLKEPIKPLSIINRGKPLSLHVISHAVKLPHHVAKRQADAVLRVLRNTINVEYNVELETYPPERDPHLGPGSGVLVYLDTSSGSRLGGDSVGEKGKPAEIVGEEAARILLEDYETGMAFDRHMADMLIPYMFLAKGTSSIGVARVTLHAITAIEVAKAFIPGASVTIHGDLDKPGIITVTSAGFSS